MAAANRTWGEEGIAAELLLNWAVTSRRERCGGTCRSVRRHTTARGRVVEHIRAESRRCGLGVRFLRRDHGLVPRRLHVRDVGSRDSTDSALECYRTSHCGLDGAAIPNADLAARNASILIRDRDSICTAAFGRTVAAMGLTVLRTPLRSPQTNAFCERVIGTIRRE